MYTHQNVLFASYVAFNDSYVAQIVQVVFVSNGTEIAVLAGQRSHSRTMHHFFVALTVSNQSRYSNKHQPMLPGKLLQFRRTRHITVVAHDFAANAHRL